MSNTQTEASKAVVVKDTKNNVTRPSAGTSTGKVWEICDTLYAQATDENPITRARVIKAAEAEGVNVSTAATQYGRWRTYMSLGRETAVAVKGEAAPKKSRAKKADVAAESAAPVVESDAVVEEAPVAEGETHPAFADEADEAQA